MCVYFHQKMTIVVKLKKSGNNKHIRLLRKRDDDAKNK